MSREKVRFNDILVNISSFWRFDPGFQRWIFQEFTEMSLLTSQILQFWKSWAQRVLISTLTTILSWDLHFLSTDHFPYLTPLNFPGPVWKSRGRRVLRVLSIWTPLEIRIKTAKMTETAKTAVIHILKRVTFGKYPQNLKNPSSPEVF